MPLKVLRHQENLTELIMIRSAYSIYIEYADYTQPTEKGKVIHKIMLNKIYHSFNNALEIKIKSTE